MKSMEDLPLTSMSFELTPSSFAEVKIKPNPGKSFDEFFGLDYLILYTLEIQPES